MLGDVLGRESRAIELLDAIDADLEKLDTLKGKLAGKPKPRVLIVYLRPGITMMMGEDSNAAAMVQLARGEYAIPGLAGYKDLNAEAVVAAQPDVILCYEEGLEAFGGKQALLERPGIRETPAGKNQRVIAMDDVLLAGFGPRTGEAALKLFRTLNETDESLAKAGS
jgi:iron complex transport system substrate-binding protein